MEFRALCLAAMQAFFVRILYNLVRKEINLMSKKMRSNILLLITAAIWGSSFVAQKSGMDYIEPFTYNGIRTLIGGLVLIPVIYVFSKKNAGADGAPQKIFDWEKDKVSIIGGLFCGAALFVASSLQQFGVMYTTVGKAGFITTLYIAFVPIISIFMRKRVRPIMWLCVSWVRWDFICSA